jgi:hypothetical protein
VTWVNPMMPLCTQIFFDTPEDKVKYLEATVENRAREVSELASLSAFGEIYTLQQLKHEIALLDEARKEVSQ